MRTNKSLHTFSIHGGTLFALMFGLGLPACDGVDEGGAAANANTDTDASTDTDTDADADADADAAAPGAALPLAESLNPQAAGNYPTFEVGAPFRVEDFKPNHYPVIFQHADAWHDVNVERYDGGWDKYREGTSSGEPNQLAWGMPVYAGVDGEVLSCWRTAPYNAVYTDVENMLLIGGNFITIKTAAGQYVFYAHLDANSIPSALCPNVSTNATNPGYLQVCDRDTSFPNNCEVCNDNGFKQCSDVETYIPAGNRPQVRKGQFIGRVGAIGQAAEAHLHMQAGDVNTVSGIDRLGAKRHVTFENTWQAPYSTSTPPFAWELSSGMSIPDAVTNGRVVLWTAPKREETYSGSYRMSNLGGGVGADLLCHDTDSGNLYVDVDGAGTDVYGTTNWSLTANWCKGASERLYTGKFNGDVYTDILCHDRESGVIKVDHGVRNASTGVVEFTGVNFTQPIGWCNGDTEQLLVGDFDTDLVDDLLCHDHATGARKLDRAYNGIGGSDETVATAWCYGKDQRLHVGNFDADPGDDLLCHDVITGGIFFDTTPGATPIFFGATVFSGTDKTTGPWCYARGQRLFAGDISASSTLDSLICHDSDTGLTYINAPTGAETYPGTSSTGTANPFCTGPHDRLKVGDVDADNRDDLVCFNLATGARSVDYAATETTTGGVFSGVNWSATNMWCNDPDQSLH